MRIEKRKTLKKQEKTMSPREIHQAYKTARERYAELGIDTELALEQLNNYAVSLDATPGYEALSTDSLQHDDEALRNDFLQARRQLPGEIRLTLHAVACDDNRYDEWMEWSRKENVSLDLHVATGSSREVLTLSSANMTIRKHWVEQIGRFREKANELGENQKKPCIMTLEIDDRLGQPPLNLVVHRQMLEMSLSELLDKRYCWMRDCLIPPQTDTASTAFVASREQLMAYAQQYKVMLGLKADDSNFTLSAMTDTIASLSHEVPELMLSLPNPCSLPSRSTSQMQGDGDDLFRQILCSGRNYRTHYSLCYRPCPTGRVGAFVIGVRTVQKCMLRVLLEPIQRMQDYELNGFEYEKNLLLENCKSLPWASVYDEYCLRSNIVG